MKEWLSKRNTLEKVALGIGAAFLVVLVIGLIAGDDRTWKEKYNEEAPVEKPKDNFERADVYAYEASGNGKRFGCSLKNPVPGGCRYAAALSACLDALSGKPFEKDGPAGYRAQFPEPEYYAVAEQAYADCSKPGGWNPQGS